MKAKSGRVWSKVAPAVHRRGLQDIIRTPSGIRREVHADSEMDAFKLLHTPEMLDIIGRETNREGERKVAEWNAANPENTKQWKSTCVTEIQAVIGLVMLAGLHRGRLEPLEALWSARNGRPIFTAVMSLKRFKSLRRATDKLAAFRDIWEMFLAQLPKLFIPGTDITVDEQLVSFRGRCSFCQFMPNKPAKYGIKIWWACDASTSYPLAGEIYLGRQPGADREVNQGSRVVKSLTKNWLRSGRNVVTDNFFTSVELAEDLYVDYTTLVGTIRKNKSDIPKQLTTKENREEKSSIFAFSGNLTLVSYAP